MEKTTNLAQELEALKDEVEKLRDTMNLNFNLIGSRIENALKAENEKPKETRLIPFDIEKAKQGAKLVTKEGANARIICYDRKSEDYPIVAAVMDSENDDVDEEIVTYTKDGTYYNDGDESFYDLRIQED